MFLLLVFMKIVLNIINWGFESKDQDTDNKQTRTIWDGWYLSLCQEWTIYSDESGGGSLWTKFSEQPIHRKSLKSVWKISEVISIDSSNTKLRANRGILLHVFHNCLLLVYS